MFPTDETWARIEQVLDAIPYDQLAPIYCDYGGEAFFADRRPAIGQHGRSWAAALGSRLQAPTSANPRASLYVGAGIAEIPALLTEACDLGRSVHPTNLRAEECAILNRALGVAGLESIRFEALDGSMLEVAGAVDHVSLVSVLDDPETYPWVSAVTYGRVDPVSLDLQAFAEEREAVLALARRCLDRLVTPGVITTTAEEIPWLLAVGGDDIVMAADDELIETAIVGDPVGFLTVTAPTVRGSK